MVCFASNALVSPSADHRIAVDVENIFATGSSPLRLQELQLIFDNPPRYGKGLDWTSYTVHDAANVLLRYLLQLPEPVIPLAFYARFRDPLASLHSQALSSVNDFDFSTAIQTYETLIREISSLNRQLLLYILDILAVFAARSDGNKMTTPRIAAVFQPGILCHDQHRCSVADQQLSQDVLIFLIDHQDYFLIGMENTALDHGDVDSAQSHIPTDA